MLRSLGLNSFYLICNILEKLKNSFSNHFSSFPFIPSPSSSFSDTKKKNIYIYGVHKGIQNIYTTSLLLTEIGEFSISTPSMSQTGISIGGISQPDKCFLLSCCLHLGTPVSTFSIHRKHAQVLFPIKEVKHNRKNKTNNDTLML